MGSGPAFEAMAALRAARDAFAATDTSMLTVAEKLALSDEYEEFTRQWPAESHRLLVDLVADTSARELGAKTWNEVLRTRWRLSSGEAGRRLGEAEDLAPRRQVTGPPLPPRLPAVAAAQALGFLPAEHVTLLRKTLNDDLPDWVDAATRGQVEVDLVRAAVGQGYEALRRAIRVRLAQLDQDGPDPDAVEKERARKRSATTGKQGADLLTALTVNMDPELAAMVEVLFAKFAAPGMGNPDDPEPCLSGTPTQAQIDNDHRTLAQRRHDALKTVLRIVLMSNLGKLNGLPVSIIIRTTLHDLESRGIAITGGGTLLTMTDVDRLGGHAEYHLCVFDGKTGSAINHFRSKRVATAAQRAMLIAQHGVGCTKPGCTVDTHGVQAHHAVKDWAADGQTNVDEMAPACGGDNNDVGPGKGYTTRINHRGECEWIPHPHLDTGQDRVNIIHRPEALLTPTDGDPHTWTPPVTDPAPAAEPEPLSDNDIPAEVDVAVESEDTTIDEPLDPWASDTEPEPEPEPADPWVNTHTDQPPPEPTGEPEPYSPFATDDNHNTRSAHLEAQRDGAHKTPGVEVLPVVTDPDAPIPYELTGDAAAHPGDDEPDCPDPVATADCEPTSSRDGDRQPDNPRGPPDHRVA